MWPAKAFICPPCLIWASLDGSDGKESAYNAEDLGLIPGLGRSPGKGTGSPLKYSCLENPMDRGAWQATVHGITKESDTTSKLNNNNEILHYETMLIYSVLLLLLLFSLSVMYDSLPPRGLQHTRLPCPSPFPGVCSNSCPLSQWCYPTISSSAARSPFTFSLFPMVGSPTLPNSCSSLFCFFCIYSEEAGT